MKIQIEHYEEKHTFESVREDYTITEMMEIIKNLLISTGYGIELINQHFKDENEI